MDESKLRKATTLLEQYREFIIDHANEFEMDLKDLADDSDMLGEILTRQDAFNSKLQGRYQKMKNEIMSLHGFA